MKRVAAQAGSEEQPGPDDALLTLVPAALLAIRLRGDTEDALQTAIVEVRAARQHLRMRLLMSDAATTCYR